MSVIALLPALLNRLLIPPLNTPFKHLAIAPIGIKDTPAIILCRKLSFSWVIRFSPLITSIRVFPNPTNGTQSNNVDIFLFLSSILGSSNSPISDIASTYLSNVYISSSSDNSTLSQ